MPSRSGRSITLATSLLAFSACSNSPPSPEVTTSALVTKADVAQSVLTNRYNNARTGWNTNETTLTQANVNPDFFGKISEHRVRGAVPSQPLYAHGVLVGTRTMNLLLIVTMNNEIYAYDTASEGSIIALGTDGSSTTGLVWHTGRVGMPGVPPFVLPSPGIADPATDIRGVGFGGGILSTPVIDATTDRIYAISRHGDASSHYRFQLNELALATGRVLNQVTIDAPSVGGPVVFDPRFQQNRPGLLLLGNYIYAAFAAGIDQPPYHGWVLRFDKRDLHAVPATFCSTPSANPVDGKPGQGGGIWQGGAGLAADPSGIYFNTGNRAVYADDAIPTTPIDFENSVVRLNPTDMSATKFVPPDILSDESPDDPTPTSWPGVSPSPFGFHRDRRPGAYGGDVCPSAGFGGTTTSFFRLMEAGDADLSSGGMMLIPGGSDGSPSRLVGGGKPGILYVLMTGALSSASQIQSFQGSYDLAPGSKPAICYASGWDQGAHLHGAPILWDGAGGSRVFVWGERDRLRGYSLDRAAGRIVLSPGSTRTGTIVSPPLIMPGGILEGSSNGNVESSAIVWANVREMDDAGHIYAFAGTLGAPLWDHRLGAPSHLSPPTIASGRVYQATGRVATVDGFDIMTVNVYGAVRPFRFWLPPDWWHFFVGSLDFVRLRPWEMDGFAADKDGAVITTWWDRDSADASSDPLRWDTWHHWHVIAPPGTARANGPIRALNGDTESSPRVDIAAVSPAGQVVTSYLDAGLDGGAWQPWTAVPGVQIAENGQPPAFAVRGGIITMAVAGAEGSVWTASRAASPNSSWGAWQPIAAAGTVPPSASIDAFSRFADGRSIELAYVDKNGHLAALESSDGVHFVNSSTSAASVPLPAGAPLAGIVPEDGAAELYAIDDGGMIRRFTSIEDSQGVIVWKPAAGPTGLAAPASAIAALASPSNTRDVWAATKDGAIMTCSWAANVWGACRTLTAPKTVLPTHPIVARALGTSDATVFAVAEDLDGKGAGRVGTLRRSDGQWTKFALLP